MLAFRNPTLLSNLGEIFYDSPFIHVDIEADFYLFHPKIGSFLKGKLYFCIYMLHKLICNNFYYVGIVKKKGLDHIVVQVHKIYTVSIPKPDDTEEWTGELVEIGQEVKCCVNHIDNRSKPPFIGATLSSNYSQDCRLLDSINNIDNVDSAIESMNSTIKLETLANGISEEDGVSEKEKKKHRKKHKKSRESDSNYACKIENDTVLNSDESLNNLEVNNRPKKHKKSKKSLLNDDTISDEYTELRKAMKRESSIPLDSIIKTETKKRKKHTKKSREFDSESEIEEKVINNTENMSRFITSEEQHTHKKQSNADLLSSNLEDSISKKHKKNKKASMKMSDSKTESHIGKVKIEKQDRFINESQIAYSETLNLNENLETSKRVKREVSIEYDSFEQERKKSPKKHTITSRDSLSKLVKIKTEDDTSNDANDISEKERKKSPKKHANVLRDSDSEIRIKNEYITNDINDISRASKRDPKEFQDMKYNISAMDNSLNNSDLGHISKKSKKRKTSTIFSDSELKSPVKVKIEKV